ncbi:MAG TPA: glycine cleavage T C-terminal barrel domain-containing protein [Kofleriaceae bacterium]|nr:glycine cleavage T C-terminal barrel domain-containing protein [Kofleriaceae bacterium]
MPLVDYSHWGHLALTGGDRVRFLQGLTTINVSALEPGGHAWGAILSPKGRVLTVVEATMEAERVLVHCEPSLVEKTVGLLEKYAVMDDVVTTPVALVAHKTWATPAEAWKAPFVFAPPPGPVTGAGELEIARVEAGLLVYGQDVDEDTFPFETPLAAWLDYNKGCYVGQEPVFRVHAQGQGARVLRGLRLDGDGAVDRGTVVKHASRDKAGTVTSAAVSPRFGSIAMAYLHRTVWDVGGEVEVDGRTARVVELPFA